MRLLKRRLSIKDILDKANAACYCKTSGATGLHVYIPLHAAYHYDQVRSFAQIIATLAQEQLPDSTTIERALNKRNGRIYIDYLQNKSWANVGICLQPQTGPQGVHFNASGVERSQTGITSFAV